MMIEWSDFMLSIRHAWNNAKVSQVLSVQPVISMCLVQFQLKIESVTQTGIDTNAAAALKQVKILDDILVNDILAVTTVWAAWRYASVSVVLSYICCLRSLADMYGNSSAEKQNLQAVKVGQTCDHIYGLSYVHLSTSGQCNCTALLSCTSRHGHVLEIMSAADQEHSLQAAKV